MDKNWIVWCPTAKKPSTRRFTEKQARVVAEKLSDNNRGDVFYACKIMTEAKTVTLHQYVWKRTKKVK